MQQRVEKKNEVSGYPLFFIEEESRHRNRGVVMANIIEDHTKDGLMSARGTATLLEYFRLIGPVERKLAFSKLQSTLKERGVPYEDICNT